MKSWLFTNTQNDKRTTEEHDGDGCSGTGVPARIRAFLVCSVFCLQVGVAVHVVWLSQMMSPASPPLGDIKPQIIVFLLPTPPTCATLQTHSKKAITEKCRALKVVIWYVSSWHWLTSPDLVPNFVSGDYVGRRHRSRCRRYGDQQISNKRC